MTELQVFVSKPRTVTESYRAGIDGFYTRITQLGFVARTLGVSAVGKTNPLEDIVELVDQTHGMIVLGWPQVQVHQGSLRGEPLTDISFATEWNHIEPAIARARGKPTIFLRERSVAARGMLDAAALGTYVREIDGLRADWADDLSEVLPPFRQEMEAYQRRHISYESLCVLRILCSAAFKSGVTVATLRKELSYTTGKLRGLLNALVTAKQVDWVEYQDSRNEYKITSIGRAFFEGFSTGAAWDA